MPACAHCLTATTRGSPPKPPAGPPQATPARPSPRRRTTKGACSMAAQPISQPRAAVYVRVSTDKQEDNTSLDTQEAACRAYAAEHGYTVVGVWREVYSGARLHERPQLADL